MEIVKSQQDGKVILEITGKLSAASAEEFGAAVDAVVAESKTLVLDFKKVSYLASAGLRVLVAAQKKILVGCGALTIINVDDTVMEVFEVTGLDEVFDVRKL
jgi:anti-anti-sigma factor